MSRTICPVCSYAGQPLLIEMYIKNLKYNIIFSVSTFPIQKNNLLQKYKRVIKSFDVLLKNSFEKVQRNAKLRSDSTKR